MASASWNDYFDGTNTANSSIRSGTYGKTGSDEAPLDLTYYKMLNVSPTATGTEIKKAYYTLSLQYHPDRTQDLDDFTRREYAERFKLISQAYSILSDPEKRTLYNRYGKDERVMSHSFDATSVEQFDAEEFFRFMFGGEEFIDIIGDFELAKSFKHCLSELIDEDLVAGNCQSRREAYVEERTRFRDERIQVLSYNLIVKLSIYTDAFTNENEHIEPSQVLNTFVEIVQSEIPRLLQAPHGEELLHCIGYIYSSKARFWLTKMDSKEGHWGKRILGYGKHVHAVWKGRVHTVKEAVKTVKSAVELQQKVSQLNSAMDENSDDYPPTHPYPYHHGHLEYSGSETATASTASASNSCVHVSSDARGKQKHRSSQEPAVPLTDEQRRKLESDTVAKSMEALWRVLKLEVEAIEKDVCDKVLNDQSCSVEVRRRRCKALSRMGDLWQRATLPHAS